MRNIIISIVGITSALVQLAQASAVAQEFPDRPVTIINQTAAGSGPDVVSRIVGEHLTRMWGHQVVTLNRPGASGLIAARAAASATPDGYTLYMPTSTALVVLPETNSKMPIDFTRDFVTIGMVGETPMAIAVSTKLGFTSLSQLIETAKVSPQPLLYAANNRGSIPHLAGAYLSKKANISLTFVPHTGAASALNNVLSDSVPIIVESLSALTGTAEGGSIKLLAVTSSSRLEQFPDLPTVAESIPGFLVTGWFALLAPTGTPDAVVRKIAIDLRTVLSTTELRTRFEALGVYPRIASPSDTAAFIRSEREVWRPIIKEAGLATP
jgi:tripartite-type tricarboxylate transporter receptor subunit TctC